MTFSHSRASQCRRLPRLLSRLFGKPAIVVHTRGFLNIISSVLCLRNKTSGTTNVLGICTDSLGLCRFFHCGGLLVYLKASECIKSDHYVQIRLYKAAT